MYLSLWIITFKFKMGYLLLWEKLIKEWVKGILTEDIKKKVVFTLVDSNHSTKDIMVVINNW